jgi:hypothetical protein
MKERERLSAKDRHTATRDLITYADTPRDASSLGELAAAIVIAISPL